MTSVPGILYVTMQRSSDLSANRFQDWYNNEHGPLRLRLSDFVTNGFRYRAADLQDSGKGKPEWMAIYDITDMAELTKDAYMKLRGDPIQSQRERDLRPSITIDRRSFDDIKEWKGQDFEPIEKLDESNKDTGLVAVSVTLKDRSQLNDITKWLDEEHIPSIRKSSGWLRSRAFQTSFIDKLEQVEYLILHDVSGQQAPTELLSQVRKAWPEAVASKVTQQPLIRTYNLHYAFGAAPRDIAPLHDSSTPPFDSPATETRTLPSSAGGPAIESYITTPDGVRLRYRLEGSADPNAPLIVLSNSILVSHGIWDDFVKTFFSHSQNQKYRILRYQTRGRTSDCGEKPVTMDLLASDIVALLDALRVPQAALAIGVSLGGATVLNAALNHPTRFARFMACDTNSKAPAANQKQWAERVAMAEKEGAVSAAGKTIVGDELAEITTRRWFVKESYEGGEIEKECLRVKKLVHENSLEGFRKAVQALCDYDFSDKMGACKGKGRFLVGAGDGVLPKTMKEMAAALGNGKAELVVIEGAGHLPMVEKPADVVEAVVKFLEV